MVAGVQQGGLGVPVLAGGFAAEAIDRAVAGGRDDPTRGARRHAAGRLRLLCQSSHVSHDRLEDLRRGWVAVGLVNAE